MEHGLCLISSSCTYWNIHLWHMLEGQKAKRFKFGSNVFSQCARAEWASLSQLADFYNQSGENGRQTGWKRVAGTWACLPVWILGKIFPETKVITINGLIFCQNSHKNQQEVLRSPGRIPTCKLVIRIFVSIGNRWLRAECFSTQVWFNVGQKEIRWRCFLSGLRSLEAWGATLPNQRCLFN